MKKRYSTKYKSIFNDFYLSEWRKGNGDLSYRLEYPLNHNSIVFDIGGYEGRWASDIYDRYFCNLYIFEPVQEYANNIKKRFGQNNKLRVFPFGLADIDAETQISIAKDSSSIYRPELENFQTVKMTNFSNFVKDAKISFIDLMKINIEGGEYSLLKHLINTDWIESIGNLQVQFHYFIPDAVQKREKLQLELIKTHKLTYCFPFVWENWKLNK